MSNCNTSKIYYVIGINQKTQKISAALNRVQSIKKGFDLNNFNSEIILVNAKTNHNKLFNKVKTFMYVFFKLLRASSGDVFIFYGNLSQYILVPLFKKKLRFIAERNEFPSYLIKQGKVSIVDKKKEIRLLKFLKHFDGMISCSTALSSYYSTFLNNKAEILICPLVIDIEKFSRKSEIKPITGDYFAYCGRLGNNKDGVPILIDSFAEFSKIVDSVNLYIVGNATATVENELKEKVRNLQMTKRIIFAGPLPHEKLIPILQNAKLLLLARPNNKQAEGGIPSKIGEYMAVKVPMVLTKVGELDNFLTDSENCFMAKPNDIEAFKLKMLEAFYSPIKENIAQNAYETAQQFDIKNQAKSIFEFCIKRENTTY